MSIHWRESREIGHRFFLKLMRWIALTFGRRFSRIILPLICCYYLTFSSDAKKASRQFLRRALSREPSWRDVYRHYYNFAATILDRVYLVANKASMLSIEESVNNPDNANRSNYAGCFMLGSHLGSFEAMRYYGLCKHNKPLKVLMDEQMTEQLNRYLYALNPSLKESVISIGRPGSLFEVCHAIKSGFRVGVLGDRVFKKERSVLCHFMGEEVLFPSGPILLASMSHAPVILCFGIYLGGNRYRIIFETFAEQIILDREQRDQQLAEWVQRYVARLEYYAKQYPYNWFNFYDYSNQASEKPA